MRSGYEVFGIDAKPEAIDDVRKLAASLSPRLPESTFRVEAIESMTIPDQSVDVVLSSAVAHFSRDDDHFWAQVNAMWRARMSLKYATVQNPWTGSGLRSLGSR